LPEFNSANLIASNFLIDRIPEGDSCDDESCLVLLGDKGGRECLLESEKLGERYLELLPPDIGSGIETGAVSEVSRARTGLPL
jgi:hypothetical protein